MEFLIRLRRCVNCYGQRLTISRAALTCSFTDLDNSRNSSQPPPVQAFWEALSLPSGDLGPVDCVQGFQVRIKAACRALRSGVQGVAMLVLQ